MMQEKPPLHVQMLTSWPLESTAGSGVVTVIRSLAASFSELGTPVRLISPSFTPDGYTHTTFRRIAFNLSNRGLDSVSPSQPVREVILGFDFDGFWVPKNLPLVSVIGGILADIVQFESGWIRWMVAVQARLERRTARRANLVITPSQFAREKVATHYGVPPTRIRVIPNGIHYHKWMEGLDQRPPEKREEITILTVARLYKRKGIHFLIHALKKICGQEPNVRLNIVGDGLEHPSLTQLARQLGIGDRVRFVGDVSDFSELCGHYMDCDVFCLPSLHETFGLVYLEAMMAEKPIVAFRNTAVPEVVRDGEHGLLAESENVDSLAEKLLRLIRDPELRRNLSKNSRQYVKENFDWKPITLKYLKTLDDLG